jgi:hypothetical protein
VTADQIVPVLAWLSLAIWITALVLGFRGSRAAAAGLYALLALPFLITSVFTLVKYAWDPVTYTRQYGTAALVELRQAGAVAGLALLAVFAAWRTIRGHRAWAVLAALLTGAGIPVLFYFAYFFRIF